MCVIDLFKLCVAKFKNCVSFVVECWFDIVSERVERHQTESKKSVWEILEEPADLIVFCYYFPYSYGYIFFPPSKTYKILSWSDKTKKS